MKPWPLLIAGVVLIITPQIIIGVIAANTAWVQSSYLHTLGAIESHGEVASAQVRMYELPGMPAWMMVAITVFGLLMCLIAIWFMVREHQRQA